MRVSTAVVAGTAEATRPATTVVKIALYQLSYSRFSSAFGSLTRWKGAYSMRSRCDVNQKPKK